MIIEFLGRHGEVLKSISPASSLWPPLCKSVSIREDQAADRKVHFPNRAPVSNWDEARKIAGAGVVAR